MRILHASQPPKPGSAGVSVSVTERGKCSLMLRLFARQIAYAKIFSVFALATSFAGYDPGTHAVQYSTCTSQWHLLPSAKMIPLIIKKSNVVIVYNCAHLTAYAIRIIHS